MITKHFFTFFSLFSFFIFLFCYFRCLVRCVLGTRASPPRSGSPLSCSSSPAWASSTSRPTFRYITLHYDITDAHIQTRAHTHTHTHKIMNHVYSSTSMTRNGEEYISTLCDESQFLIVAIIILHSILSSGSDSNFWRCECCGGETPGLKPAIQPLIDLHEGEVKRFLGL